MKDTIHIISSILELPAIAILIAAVALTLFELGSLFAEFFIARLGKGKTEARLKAIVDKAAKNADADKSEAVAAGALAHEEQRRARRVLDTDLVARIAPMFGLMATLIPLGPGLIALGQGDTKTLSESLLTAFDATVAGLAAAGVSYIISRVRKAWYASDMQRLEEMFEEEFNL